MTSNVTHVRFVDFPHETPRHIARFRDELSRVICQVMNLESYRRTTGHWPEIDCVIYLYGKEDRGIFDAFSQLEVPGLLSLLFKTREYQRYQAASKRLESATKVELLTSHDPPWGVGITHSALPDLDLSPFIAMASERLARR